jgi:small subunit ribosomal protein S8e
MKTLSITRVVESHNPEFVRMNIITRGAVLETEIGKVRVTNRVGQDGVVNAVAL